MATVGFIGSGRIGRTVARVAVAGGYDVLAAATR
jgi:phosphoglycerate dehydrogenase-like enzyme